MEQLTWEGPGFRGGAPVTLRDIAPIADRPPNRGETWDKRAARKHLGRTYAAALERFAGAPGETVTGQGQMNVLGRLPDPGRPRPFVQGALTAGPHGRAAEQVPYAIALKRGRQARATPEQIVRATVQGLRSCGQNWLVGETADGRDVVEGVWLCHNRLCPTCAALTQQAWVRRLQPLFAHAGTTARQYRYPTKRGGSVQIPGVWVDVDLDATGHVVWDGHGDVTRWERAQHKEDLASRAEQRGDAGAVARYAGQAAALVQREPERVRLYAFFVTLTVRNLPHIWQDPTDTDPGGSALDAALNRPWRVLRETARRRPDSKAGRFLRHIRGGADVTEITHHRAKGFHPHKHALILADVPYLAKNALRELWASYTDGAGQVVDVRPFYRAESLETGEALTPEAAIVELCKYLVKPQSEIDPAALREVVLAMRGRRRINTWGCLRELPPAEPEDALNPPDTPAVIETGRHVLYHYTPNGRRYRRMWTWPATPRDPIIPIGRGPDPAPYSTLDDITPTPADHDRDIAARLAARPVPYGRIDDRRFALDERVRQQNQAERAARDGDRARTVGDGL